MSTSTLAWDSGCGAMLEGYGASLPAPPRGVRSGGWGGTPRRPGAGSSPPLGRPADRLGHGPLPASS
eukprot:6388867-Alexandrium_andersonii.AAC.1